MHDVLVVAIFIFFYLKLRFGLKWLILTFGDPKTRRGSFVLV